MDKKEQLLANFLAYKQIPFQGFKDYISTESQMRMNVISTSLDDLKDIFESAGYDAPKETSEAINEIVDAYNTYTDVDAESFKSSDYKSKMDKKKLDDLLKEMEDSSELDSYKENNLDDNDTSMDNYSEESKNALEEYLNENEDNDNPESFEEYLNKKYPPKSKQQSSSKNKEESQQKQNDSNDDNQNVEEQQEEQGEQGEQGGSNSSNQNDNQEQENENQEQDNQNQNQQEDENSLEKEIEKCNLKIDTEISPNLIKLESELKSVSSKNKGSNSSATSIIENEITVLKNKKQDLEHQIAMMTLAINVGDYLNIEQQEAYDLPPYLEKPSNKFFTSLKQLWKDELQSVNYPFLKDDLEDKIRRNDMIIDRIMPTIKKYVFDKLKSENKLLDLYLKISDFKSAIVGLDSKSELVDEVTLVGYGEDLILHIIDSKDVSSMIFQFNEFEKNIEIYNKEQNIKLIFTELNNTFQTFKFSI